MNSENNKLQNQTEQGSDMSVSCCMEVSGIESMVTDIDPPHVNGTLVNEN